MWSSLIGFALLLTDYGWQKTPDGDLEYIIQIEPELLDALKRGEEIASVVPPQLGKVTRFRIRVGTGPVPRDPKVLQSRGKVRTLPGEAEGHPAGPTPERTAPTGAGSLQAPGQEAKHPHQTAPATGRAAEGKPAITIRQPPKPIPRKPAAEAVPIERASGFRIDDTPRAKPDRARDGQKAEPSRPASKNAPAAAKDTNGPGREKATGGEAGSKAAPSTPSPKASPKPSQDSSAPGQENAAEIERPWGALVFTSLLLFASLALNLYLGWVARGAIQRYRELVCTRG